MSSHFDTIFAPITGIPPSPVAIVRLSGPESWEIVGRIFHPWRTDPEPRKAVYGRFSHGDDGLALPFEDGHSFTGEQSAELSIHGSRASLQALLRACEAEGARPAEPGEFTERAFLNGRIDLTQAEAVRETIDAETDAQLRVANRNREGALRNQVRSIRESVLTVLAQVEASVDFSEEIGELDRPAAATQIRACISAIRELVKGAKASRLIRQGLRIAIVGPPNAGKSSLLNALLKMERSIVSDIPGTTRDYVEERADFEGYAVVLIDTAGLRETTDVVESIGVQRARAAAADADLIWYVMDSTDPAADGVEQFDRTTWILANKCDLGGGGESAAVNVSARTGQGLDTLVTKTIAFIQDSPTAHYVNDRQRLLLEATLLALDDAVQHLEGDTPTDLLSVLLGEALASLGAITGDMASPDAISEIFSRFCIGK